MSAVNVRLRPLGLVYGAGYVLGMKPSFFLGGVTDSRILEGLQVDLVGRELARDIYMTPAMRQGPQVFARQSAMLFFMWDQILEMRPSAREPLDYALHQYGLDAEALRRHPERQASALHQVAAQELETWIYHEVGEVQEHAFDGQVWHEIVSTYSNSLVEIFAESPRISWQTLIPRACLAISSATAVTRPWASTWPVMRPFTRAAFPEIVEAFRQFRLTDDWSVIDQARSNGHAKAEAFARSVGRNS